MSLVPALTVVAGVAAGSAVALALRSPPTLRGPGPRAGPGVLLLVVVGGAVLAVVAGSPVAALLAVVAGGLLLGIRALLGVRRRRAEAARTSARVMEACELLSSELASGQAPVVALRRAAGEWPYLAPVAEAATLGGDPSRALVELAAAPGASDLRLVAAAWSVAHRTGGGLADALDRVASAVRGRRATQRVVESELASARATARLVAALPVVMLLLGSGDGGGAWRFLLGHPVGLACLGLGLGLGLLGLWWIERIADEVTR